MSKTNDRILINNQYPGRLLRLDGIKAYNPAHLSDTTAHCSWLSARPEQSLVWQMSVLTAPKTKNGLHQVENHSGSYYHRPYWCHFAKVAVAKKDQFLLQGSQVAETQCYYVKEKINEASNTLKCVQIECHLGVWSLICGEEKQPKS